MIVYRTYECFVMQLLYLVVLSVAVFNAAFCMTGRGCHNGYEPLCNLCRNLLPSGMWPDFVFLWGKPAMRTHWMAGAPPHKSG